MKTLNHPFILRLEGVAQDKRIVYMYTEFMVCGDLMETINKFGKLSADHAKFYAAHVITCLDYLHQKGLIYRDIKPENVLMQQTGYLKLADFGFIKKLAKGERTYTFCGTPEYMAPELVQNQGYSHAVDWYALGIFMYEMMYGRPPFMANDPYKIFQMILKEKLRFPRDFDKDAKSLIKKLCEHDLTKRYGNMVGGVKDIKRHRLFKNFDWNALLAGKVPAPYRPSVKKQSSSPLKAVKGVTAKHLEESNDNDKYPPIKETKDPFLKWF